MSNVTVRGVEIVFASASLLIKERTAFTPSAFRKPTAGVRPLAVLKARPPDPPPMMESRTVVVDEDGVVVITRPPGKVVVVGWPGIVVVLWPVMVPLPQLKC